MPRINAASVAEHVAQQEAAVFDAAIRLFSEQGYANVSMADIAGEVGLARNSLYRYYPDKADILLRWYRVELPTQAARARATLTGDSAPGERIATWTIDQLDYARQPEHALLVALADVVPHLDDEARRELTDSHQQVLAPLSDVLAETGVTDPVERQALTDLIGGIIVAQSQRESRVGDDPPGRRYALTAIEALVGAGTAATPGPGPRVDR